MMSGDITVCLGISRKILLSETEFKFSPVIVIVFTPGVIEAGVMELILGFT